MNMELIKSDATDDQRPARNTLERISFNFYQLGRTLS